MLEPLGIARHGRAYFAVPMNLLASSVFVVTFQSSHRLCLTLSDRSGRIAGIVPFEEYAEPSGSTGGAPRFLAERSRGSSIAYRVSPPDVPVVATHVPAIGTIEQIGILAAVLQSMGSLPSGAQFCYPFLLR